jgi:hypothetical protein
MNKVIVTGTPGCVFGCNGKQVCNLPQIANFGKREPCLLV